MHRRLAATLFSTALLVAVAGCGDDGGDGGDDQPTGPAGRDQVTVGLIPIVDVAPLFLGIEQGFFEDRNIDVTTDFAAGGAEIIPGVQSGTYDFGFSNVISLMLAQASGIELKVVANGNNSTGVDGEDFGSLMVPVDSPVQSAAELGDATIAINTLNNISDPVVRESVRKAGGDPAGIEFVGVPFPEMEAALANGDADAVFVVEPFQTIIRNNGVGRSVASSWVDAAPDLTVAAYFTSTAMIDENPDLVQRFTEAMTEALAFANENEEAVRNVITTYTDMQPQLASEITLPAWPPEINRASSERLAQLAIQDGLLAEPPDLDALYP
ncbi:MAG TPA: ABC transporter substrate-binding protein [Natronosporangium sp.]